MVAKIVRLASGIAGLIAVVAIAGAGILTAALPIEAVSRVAVAPGCAVASDRQLADDLPITSSSAPQAQCSGPRLATNAGGGTEHRRRVHADQSAGLGPGPGRRWHVGQNPEPAIFTAGVRAQSGAHPRPSGASHYSEPVCLRVIRRTPPAMSDLTTTSRWSTAPKLRSTTRAVLSCGQPSI